jgi:hypothetical protein
MGIVGGDRRGGGAPRKRFSSTFEFTGGARLNRAASGGMMG